MLKRFSYLILYYRILMLNTQCFPINAKLTLLIRYVNRMGLIRICIALILLEQYPVDSKSRRINRSCHLLIYIYTCLSVVVSLKFSIRFAGISVLSALVILILNLFSSLLIYKSYSSYSFQFSWSRITCILRKCSNFPCLQMLYFAISFFLN